MQKSRILLKNASFAQPAHFGLVSYQRRFSIFNHLRGIVLLQCQFLASGERGNRVFQSIQDFRTTKCRPTETTT
jgi:hypothetical protein